MLKLSLNENTHRERIIGICILVVLLTCGSVLYNFNFFQENKRINYEDLVADLTYEKTELKNAAYWDLSGSPIFIDDTNSSNNWVFTAANYAWCTGSGTYSDPYIIENVFMDAGNVGSGISISNSNVHFIIQNSTVSYAGAGSSDAGIKLTNTSNGQLINNTISNNGRHGIYIYNYSHNNTISRNQVKDNSYMGIYLKDYSYNNTISGNEHTLTGIWLNNHCDNNTISGNKLSSLQGDGIFLTNYCDGNTISGNDANDNVQSGIRIGGNSDKNIISGNNVSNVLTANQDIGIYITGYSDNNIIVGNNANDNLDYGIFLEGQYGSSNDNIISGNNASNVLTINQNLGIYLERCDGNTVYENNANDNVQSGIYLYNSQYNNITENNISSNIQNGIYLNSHSNGNTISGNDANDNGQNGIYLSSLSNDNIISRNNANNNGQNGIYIDSVSQYNIISGNNANNNGQNGIYLYNWCHFSTILGNYANNNTEDGISLEDSILSIISQNLVNNNTNYGIELVTSGANSVYNNFFIKNGINAVDTGTDNQWDNGATGNYWDNYSGSDNNGDGIGDIPYNISGSAKSQDRYPLINSYPNVEFSANFSLIFQRQSIQFTYMGFGGIIPLNYEWDFGDGSLPSNVPNPVHQYVTAGIYNVSLTVTDLYGDYDTELKINYIAVIVNLVPDASFNANATEIFAGQQIKFNFIGSEGNAPATYYWDFDDGFHSTEQNPVHQYITAGTYNVNLTVTDLYGEQDTRLMSIVVTDPITPPTPPPGEDAIPFGNYYMIFAALSVISLIIMMKRKFFRKSPE